jgi:hypothetical protein
MAAVGSKRARPRKTSKGVIKNGDSSQATYRESGRIPGGPQGYPTSSSRLTDARWQVKGSPGTRR